MRDERFFKVYEDYMLATRQITDATDELRDKLCEAGAVRTAMAFWDVIRSDIRMQGPGTVRRTLLNYCGCSEDEIADLEGGCGWPEFLVSRKREDCASTETVGGETVIVKPRAIFDREYYEECLERFEDPVILAMSDEEFAEYNEAAVAADLEWFDSDCGDLSSAIPEDLAEMAKAELDSSSVIIPEQYKAFLESAKNVSRQPIYGQDVGMVCSMQPPTSATVELSGKQIIIGDPRRFAESAVHARSIDILATADGGAAADICFEVAAAENEV